MSIIVCACVCVTRSVNEPMLSEYLSFKLGSFTFFTSSSSRSWRAKKLGLSSAHQGVNLVELELDLALLAEPKLELNSSNENGRHQRHPWKVWLYLSRAELSLGLLDSTQKHRIWARTRLGLEPSFEKLFEFDLLRA